MVPDSTDSQPSAFRTANGTRRANGYEVPYEIAVPDHVAADSDERLKEKSKSFYLAIKALEEKRGPHEVNKRAPVRNMYNLLRELDTIEDAPPTMPTGKKKDLMQKLSLLVDRVIERPQTDSIDDLVHGDDMRSITDALLEVIPDQTEDDKAERRFVAGFANGSVLHELHAFPDIIREDASKYVGKMATGMADYLTKGEIQTEDQLKEYCFYVAGSIGKYLTHLVNNLDGASLSEEGSKRLGELLQITNIAKNGKEDWEKGRRVYYPARWRPEDMSHQYMLEGTGISAEEARETVFGKMLTLARSNIPAALDYIQSIPEGITGYAAFTLGPYITALKTLDHLEDAGAQAVLAGEPGATKIAKEAFLGITQFTGQIATNAEKRNAFLNDFTKSPRDFEFTKEAASVWAPKYLA